MRAGYRNRWVTALAALAVVAVVSGCRLVIPLPPTDTRPWYCNPTDTAVNDGHGAAFEAAYTEEKGPLSDGDCGQLKDQLTAARSYANRFATVADAEAAGWIQAAVWTSGQGVHYVDPARLTGPFDPTRPNWLMFDGTEASSVLTGMMFLASSGAAPPAGFPGSNDHWHQHDHLCWKAGSIPFIVGEHLTDAECEALGGVNTMFADLWMVHVWLPVYDGWYAPDIFNMSHARIP